MNALGRRADRPDWLLALGGIAVAGAIFFAGRYGAMAPGAPLPFVITVVPADAQGLACSSSAAFGNERCAFDGTGRPAPVDRPLRPFVTTGGELVLLAGVFEEEHVAAWLRQSVQDGVSARVTLDCRGRFVGLADTVRVRFGAENPWKPEPGVSVGLAAACTVRR